MLDFYLFGFFSVWLFAWLFMFGFSCLAFHVWLFMLFMISMFDVNSLDFSCLVVCSLASYGFNHEEALG